MQTGPRPLWGVHLGFQSRQRLTAALSLRVWGTLPDHSRLPAMQGESIGSELPWLLHVCSQEKRGSSPGSTGLCVLGHSVPRAGAQQGMHPCLGPCLWKLASYHAGPKPQVGPTSAGCMSVGQTKSPTS